MNDAGEITILEEGNVKITNRKAIVGMKSYPISDIVSVGITRDATMLGCLIVALISGGLLLVLFSYRAAAFLFFGAAVVVALLAQPNYIVQIRSMTGSADVLRSVDQDYLKRIVDAINRAVAYQAKEQVNRERVVQT
jgi:Family of unknown function (DUF6232)